MAILEQIKVTFHKIREINESFGTRQEFKGKVTFNEVTESFNYTDSVMNFQERKRPKSNDLLYCLVSDYYCDTSDFNEFCSEMGYNNDSVKDLRIFEAVIKQKEKLGKLFNEDQVKEIDEALREKGF